MRDMLILSCAAGLLAGTAGAQTYVGGDITTDTTWVFQDSPYIVQDIIDVLDGATLTIEAGVTVIFGGHHEITTSESGNIVANGTPGNRVLFTSNAAAPAPNDWGYLSISGSASTFAYCTIEYASTGLYLYWGAAEVSHITVRHCERGICCWGSSPTIEHCRITQCHVGIQISRYPSEPIIHLSYIYGNSDWNVLVLHYQLPGMTFNAAYNWWGTTDDKEIADKIYDSLDDPNVHGRVHFWPWLEEMSSERMSWGGVKALYER